MSNNTGHRNTGDCNTGYRNTGSWNTGDLNTGDLNTEDLNTGDWNTGNRNTGDCNTGYRNTGSWNTGDRNTGDCNAGNWNTGNGNTGSWNTGDYNTGSCNAGDCNTTKPDTVRLFNEDSGLKFHGETHLKLRSTIRKYQKSLCEWVYESKMSEQEKQDNPTYKITGGYLKVNKTFYNGKEVSKEDREFLESLPNFDADILKECTGIELNKKHKITLDGKEILLSEESYQEFKKQFND